MSDTSHQSTPETAQETLRRVMKNAQQLMDEREQAKKDGEAKLEHVFNERGAPLEPVLANLAQQQAINREIAEAIPKLRSAIAAVNEESRRLRLGISIILVKAALLQIEVDRIRVNDERD
ncbi:hypothetical protein BU16DRAFT_566332 [Lophium mytilinum]|uniref:Uncharacterized protein n=1 Tax=Lophium mytilinum TaxID=390894 RepID=A0A6A6QE57_9PEZI|nr:hypothetical protein BU16DRAFT_566332 [Lophium mytilinum]